MRYINNYKEELEIFRALSSQVRIDILTLLIRNGRMSMNDLAQALNLSGGALTPHVRKLEETGLLRINADTSRHGNLKICEPHLDKILFVFSANAHTHNEFQSHLRVGQYSSCMVYPTCGIANSTALIGDVDDPRYFTHWKHFDADILWLTKGYIEYMIPCVIPEKSRIEQISISMEISSEAPGSNPNWPSDIHFYLNDVLLGVWTCPGDYADVPGLFTPDWWFSNWNQYGLLKNLVIRSDGTFMDDRQLSSVSIGQLGLSDRTPMILRIAVPDEAKHVGGLTLFGRDFGNYNQDIEFRILYSS